MSPAQQAKRVNRWLVPAAFAAAALLILFLPAGLVHGNGVKSHPHKSALRSGMKKAVAPRVIGDDRAVFGRAQVIAPRPRCIRSLNYVFLIFIIKITYSRSTICSIIIGI